MRYNVQRCEGCEQGRKALVARCLAGVLGHSCFKLEYADWKVPYVHGNYAVIMSGLCSSLPF